MNLRHKNVSIWKYAVFILTVLSILGCYDAGSFPSDGNLVEAAALSADTTESGVVYSEDFDSGSDLDRDFGMDPIGNATAEPVNIAGRRALRISLDARRDKDVQRTEIAPTYLHQLDPENFTDYYYAKNFGQTYWYSFQLYLPPDWQYDDNEMIIWQLVSRPNRGESYRNPEIAMLIADGPHGEGRDFVLQVRGDAEQITGAAGPYDYNKAFQIGSVAEDVGRWVQWVMKVSYSYRKDGSGGELVIWKDGKRVFDRAPIQNHFNDPTAGMLEMGLYIWDWLEQGNVGKDGITNHTLYIDDLKIGTSGSRK